MIDINSFPEIRFNFDIPWVTSLAVCSQGKG